jgi:hypothetical protein
LLTKMARLSLSGKAVAGSMQSLNLNKWEIAVLFPVFAQ